MLRASNSGTGTRRRTARVRSSAIDLLDPDHVAASAWGQQTAAPIPPGAVVLDHVVAVINGSVILESDVQEEMRYAVLQPFSVDSARNTPQRALQRLIDRDLILQQMQTAENGHPSHAGGGTTAHSPTARR